MVLRNLYWKIWNPEMDLKLRNRVCARKVLSPSGITVTKFISVTTFQLNNWVCLVTMQGILNFENDREWHKTWNVFVHPRKDSPKPNSSCELRRKFQFKESKAFSKSIYCSFYILVVSHFWKFQTIAYRTNCIKNGSSFYKGILVIINTMLLCQF